MPFSKKKDPVKPVVKPSISLDDIKAGTQITFGNTLVQKDNTHYVIKEGAVGNVIVDFESGKISPQV